jgi:hypothetical protein
VHVLARVFFKVQPSDTHRHRLPIARVPGFVTFSRHNLKRAVHRKRLIILRDLVALREIRIEIVLAREDRTFLNLKPERQSRARGQLNHPPIQNGKRTRQTQAHRTRVRIRLIAKTRRASAKDFRFGAELGVDFQPDDSFPSAHFWSAPASTALWIPPCELNSISELLRIQSGVAASLCRRTPNHGSSQICGTRASRASPSNACHCAINPARRISKSSRRRVRSACCMDLSAS